MQAAVAQHTIHKPVYYRLVALWAISEAFLGGIIHGLRLPVSGLLVGSAAIGCIALIGYYERSRSAILKATLAVAIFKMMLSPQAPPMAYVAVFFQGLLGAMLVWRQRFFFLSCLLLAILAMLESALQRLLVLTIVYGTGLWKAVNIFLSGLTGHDRITNYSWWLCAGYLALHLLAGLLLGFCIARIPWRIAAWKIQGNLPVIRGSGEGDATASGKRKAKRIGWLVFWLLLLGLYMQSYYGIGTAVLPAGTVFQLLLRSLIVLIAWVFLIGPLLQYVLKRWLHYQRGKIAGLVEAVTTLLPRMRNLVTAAWRASRGKKRRWIFFYKTVLVNLIEENDVVILTGKIRSGKTTGLDRWAKGRQDIWGVLSPVLEQHRWFRWLPGGEEIEMEASGDEKRLTVGRFQFSASAFQKAAAHLRAVPDFVCWVVIDEVGPLELRGEGFSAVLKELIENRNEGQTIVLVVREELVVKVAEYFSIASFIQVRHANLLL